MNEPNPELVQDSPIEVTSAAALFATGAARRRMCGGLARLPNGQMLLTFALGAMPRRNDGAIMRSVSGDDGMSWDEPVPLYALPGWDCYPMAGPRLLSETHFRIFVGLLRFAPALGGTQPFADWRTTYIDSLDGGVTWNEPSVELALFPCWTEVYGASNPHRLADGRLMWAVSGTLDRDRDWQFGVSFSDPAGVQFTPPVLIAAGEGRGYCEGDVVRLDDGRFLALIREQIGLESVCSTSTDEGQTWSPLRPAGFKGANIKLHRLRSGAVMCLYRDEDPARRGVSASVSDDGGSTWRWIGHLYAAPPEAKHVPGHLCGYPDVIETGDGELCLILHTYADQDGEITLQFFRARDRS